MISRIALLVTAAMVSPPSPSETPALFAELDGTKIIRFNLAGDLDPALAGQILSSVDSEIKSGKVPSSLRADQLLIAKGLLLLGRKDWTGALEALQKVSLGSPLNDAASFFQAKVLLRLGEEASGKSAFKDAFERCSQARMVLQEGVDLESTPFADSAKELLKDVNVCTVRSAARLDRLAPLESLALQYLDEKKNLTAADREALDTALVKAWRRQHREVEAGLFLQEELEDHPEFKELAALRSGEPAGRTLEAAEAPAGAKNQLPFKVRDVPEEKLLAQAVKKQNRGQLEDAMKIHLQILEEYPGSVSAQKAESRFLAGTETLIRRKKIPDFLMNLAKKLPPDSQYELGKFLWQKDQDDLSYDLLQTLVNRTPAGPKTGAACFILGRIDENRGKWEKAREWFKTLVTKYSASSYYDSAHFKIGFLSVLLNDEKTALEWLEYNRALTRSSYTQAKALYWIARIQERANRPKEANRYKDEIARVAPLSFYAFLVNRFPEFSGSSTETARPKTFWNSYHLARAQALLGAGLHDAAVKTLNQLDLEREPELIPKVGLLFNAIRQHNPAFKIAYALADRSEPRRLPSTVSKILFPVDFETTIRQEARANELDPMLVFSVVKQESAYRADAESRVGALGLMQLMPTIAASLAKESNQPFQGHPDLLKGEINVKLGARHLLNTIKHYKGNVIAALAAYNAGTDRVDLWVKQWGTLPAPEFIELIPFEETRNYVKSIARNFAFYARLIENRTVDLQSLANLALSADSDHR